MDGRTATRLSQSIAVPSAEALEQARTHRFEARGQESLAKLAVMVERHSAPAG